MTTGRPNEAKKVYSDLLSQRPYDVPALLALADIAIAEKKWPEATDYITRARAAAPNDPEPGLRLVNMYALRRDWVSAGETSAELAEKFPANIDVLDTQARVQLGAGDTDGAVSTYKRAHELAPSSLPILTRYLAALNGAKNFRAARTVLQAALDRDPKNASLKSDMVRIEAEIGGLDAGLAEARGFARDDPDNGLYDVVSAELYEKAGRAGEAVALAREGGHGTTLGRRAHDRALAPLYSYRRARQGGGGLERPTEGQPEGLYRPIGSGVVLSGAKGVRCLPRRICQHHRRTPA